MLLNLNTGYADTDADLCIRIMSLCWITLLTCCRARKALMLEGQRIVGFLPSNGIRFIPQSTVIFYFPFSDNESTTTPGPITTLAPGMYKLTTPVPGPITTLASGTNLQHQYQVL